VRFGREVRASQQQENRGRLAMESVTNVLLRLGAIVAASFGLAAHYIWG
jgi:hypothetical protein